MSSDLGILDWFTILVGLASFCVMAEHGALWCAMKVEGELAARCRTVARWIWFPVVMFTALVAVAGPYVQPRLLASVSERPWGFAFSLLAIVSLIGMRRSNRGATEYRAFVFSSLYVASIVACVAFGLFSYVLPSNLDPNAGLTVYNASAPPESLKIALAWFVPGITLAIVYVFVVYRAFAGKVAVQPADTSQY